MFRIILRVRGEVPTRINRYVNPLADWILPSGGKQNGMGGSRAVSGTKAGGNGSVRNCMVSSVKLRHNVFDCLMFLLYRGETHALEEDLKIIPFASTITNSLPHQVLWCKFIDWQQWVHGRRLLERTWNVRHYV